MFDGVQSKYQGWRETLGPRLVLSPAVKSLITFEGPISALQRHQKVHDAQLLYVIQNSVTPEFERDSFPAEILDRNSGLALLRHLDSVYCPKTRTNRQTRGLELYKLRYSSYNNMDKYVNACKQAHKNLHRAGKPVAEDIVIDCLLAGLPSEQPAFAQLQAKYHAVDPSLTIDSLRAELIAAATRASSSRPTGGGSTKGLPAFLASQPELVTQLQSLLANNVSRTDRDVETCRHCHKPGHPSGICFTQMWCTHCEQQCHPTEMCPKRGDVKPLRAVAFWKQVRSGVIPHPSRREQQAHVARRSSPQASTATPPSQADSKAILEFSAQLRALTELVTSGVLNSVRARS